MRSNPHPAGYANAPGLFVALLMLLVWLPIPLGSNRPWSWALMEVWVYLMAAVWLIKYARCRVKLTEPFRQARVALILFALWLGYGLLQMVPLPAAVVEVISPHTAALHQQAQLGPRVASTQLVPNPVARPMPSFPASTAGVDLKGMDAAVQAANTGQANNVSGLASTVGADLPPAVAAEKQTDPGQEDGIADVAPFAVPDPESSAAADPRPAVAVDKQANTGQADDEIDFDLSAAANPNPGFAGTGERSTEIHPAPMASGYSARLSLDLSASITAWLKSVAYVLIFTLTLLLVDSRQRLKTLASVLVLSGLAQAVYGSLSLAIEGGGVATGGFMNRNHYAAYLVLCLSVGIGLLIATMGQGVGAGSWRQRLRHIGQLILSAKAPLRIFLAIMVIALVLTHSRMGNTAFFASMLITAILALFLLKNMPRPVLFLITSLIVIDILIIGSWVGLDKVRDRIVETTLEGEARDEFDMHSFRMWQDYPLLGAGAGSYYSVYPRYRQGDTRDGWLVDHAHNDYLELLSEYGILGLTLPAGVVILALGNAILAQRRRRNQLARGIGFAVTMAITAMLIHATVEFNLQIPAYAATFMVILAMAWLSRHLKYDNHPDPSRRVHSMHQKPPD